LKSYLGFFFLEHHFAIFFLSSMRCFVIALVLCAVASAITPQTFEQITKDENPDVGILLETAFGGFDKSWTPTELLPISSDSNATHSKDCCKCVREAAECVLKRAIKHIKKVCKHTKCPLLKRHCQFMRTHKHIARGMILAHVRPLSIAHAYCVGKGECKPKERSFLDSPFMDEALVQAEKFASLLRSDQELGRALSFEGFQRESFDRLVSRSVLTQHGVDDLSSAPDSYRHGVCRYCISLTSRVVMHHTVQRVKEFCKHTKCPAAKGWCKWAHKHPEEAFGVLLVKVRPAEWGCGFCVGKGICTREQKEAASQPAILN